MGALLLMGASAMAQTNLLEGANGKAGNTAQMAEEGWELYYCQFSKNGDSYTYVTPEKKPLGDAGNVRWENRSSDVKYEGNAYNSPVCFFRWDGGGSKHSYWFVYPVEITEAGYYNFSMLGGQWSNTGTESDHAYLKTDGNSSAIMVAFSNKIGPEGITWEKEGLSTTDLNVSPMGIPATGQGGLYIFPKTDNNKATLQKCDAEFYAAEPGTYYLEILGSHAITVLSDFQLTFNRATAVKEINMDAETVSTSYYGLDGVEITSPKKGTLVIEKRVMNDGNIKVTKKIVR